MRIIINPEITSDVFIITPKTFAPNVATKDNDIEYYHFSLNEKLDSNNDDQTKERLIEEYWYRYYYKEGNETGELLCYDDSLVILYNKPPSKKKFFFCEFKTNMQFSLKVLFQTNKKLSDYPEETYRYYKDGKDIRCINEGRSFNDFIKYFNTKYLENKNRTNIVSCYDKNVLKDPEYSLFLHSMTYYHNQGMGYEWTDLNDLLYYLFGEYIKEEDFEKYKNMEHYNQTYLPEGF